MQTQQVSDIMKAARKDGCSAGIAMQCYQHLYTMLGDVDTGSVVETSAVLTAHQAATTAATLKGRSRHHTKPHQECSPRRQRHFCEAAGRWHASIHTCCRMLAVACVNTYVLPRASRDTCCGMHQHMHAVACLNICIL